MKRNISDSLGGVISISPSDDKKNSLMYGRGFQSMLDGLDDEDCLDETGQISEKKRRLSVDQVKALEKSFEVENKLEPERKVKLAQDLGLQPRQVAVWFQNRRARWKTKQLERDYGILKANYDSLKLNFESLQHDNETLLAELNKLKSKKGDENTENTENTESTLTVKEEEMIKEPENEISANMLMESGNNDLKQDAYNKANDDGVEASLYGADMRDGSSDSDSSAILNEDNNSNGVFQLMMAASSSPSTSSLRFSCSSPSSIGFQSANARKEESYHPHQYIKMEEHNFFGSEEPCNFFAEEQAPSLHWYCPDQWN